jgi:hypothetical protein
MAVVGPRPMRPSADASVLQLVFENQRRKAPLVEQIIERHRNRMTSYSPNHRRHPLDSRDRPETLLDWCAC